MAYNEQLDIEPVSEGSWLCRAGHQKGKLYLFCFTHSLAWMLLSLSSHFLQIYVLALHSRGIGLKPYLLSFTQIGCCVWKPCTLAVQDSSMNVVYSEAVRVMSHTVRVVPLYTCVYTVYTDVRQGKAYFVFYLYSWLHII